MSAAGQFSSWSVLLFHGFGKNIIPSTATSYHLKAIRFAAKLISIQSFFFLLLVRFSLFWSSAKFGVNGVCVCMFMAKSSIFIQLHRITLLQPNWNRILPICVYFALVYSFLHIYFIDSSVVVWHTYACNYCLLKPYKNKE